MGLNITVQKGHDFSSGNVTRAALNAGATPTIAVTGSVGASELESDSVDNDSIVAGANIDISKLALTENSLIIGDENGKASALAGSTSNLNTDEDGQEGNIALLGDNGTSFDLYRTDLGTTGGHVGIQKKGSYLKLRINTGVVTGAHLDSNLFTNSVTRNSASGKLEVGSNSIGLDNLKREGTAGYILTSNGTNLDPEYKPLEIAESPVFESTASGICYYLVPTGTSKIRIQAVGGGGGGTGDWEGTDYSGCGGGAGAYAATDLEVTGNGAVKTFAEVTTAGSDYTTATNLDTTGGSGDGATVSIVASSGGITGTPTIVSGGEGYKVGDVLTVVQAGTPDASGGTITVTATNLALLRITAGDAGSKGGTLNSNTFVAAGSGGDSIVEYPLVPATTGKPAAPSGTVVLKAVGGGGSSAYATEGSGGSAANCVGDTTVSGGDGGTRTEPVIGSTMTDSVLVGGHGGHSRWGASRCNVYHSTDSGYAKSAAQGFGFGGAGSFLDDGTNSNDTTMQSEAGGRGHIKIFLLN